MLLRIDSKHRPDFPDALGLRAANRAGNRRWLLTCTLQGQMARRLVAMTRCGDAAFQALVHHAHNKLQSEGWEAGLAGKVRCCGKFGQIGCRVAMFCQPGLSAASKSILGQHLHQGMHVDCGSELLHQDGDLHAAVPDLRQS